MKKKKEYTSERLTELERQAKEYSDDDLLDEANRLEQEMKKSVTADIFSEDFFDQVMIMAKEAEAKKRRDDVN